MSRTSFPIRLGVLSAGFCLLGGLVSTLAAQEEVHLASGQVITGELVSEDSDKLVVRYTFLVHHKPMTSTQSIDKEQITQRRQVPSFLAQYEVKVKATPDTLLGHLMLARWCVDHALMQQGATQAKRADELDSDNTQVAKVLEECGYTKVHEEWVNEDEYLAKTGKVVYDGKIMDAKDAEHARAIVTTTGDHDDAIQAIKDDHSYLTHGDDKIKDASDKLAKAKETATRTKAEMDRAKNTIDQLNKRISEGADQQRQQGNGNGYGNGNGGFGGTRNGNNGNGNDLDSQASAAATEYARASQAHHTAERAVTDLTYKLDHLKKAVAKAKEDLPLQIAKLKKADADLTTLTGKAPVDDLPPEMLKELEDDSKSSAVTDEKPKNRFGDQTGGGGGTATPPTSAH